VRTIYGDPERSCKLLVADPGTYFTGDGARKDKVSITGSWGGWTMSLNVSAID